MPILTMHSSTAHLSSFKTFPRSSTSSMTPRSSSSSSTSSSSSSSLSSPYASHSRSSSTSSTSSTFPLSKSTPSSSTTTIVTSILDTLPIEIIELLLSYLSFSTRLQARLVCRYWYHLLQPLITSKQSWRQTNKDHSTQELLLRRIHFVQDLSIQFRIAPPTRLPWSKKKKTDNLSPLMRMIESFGKNEGLDRLEKLTMTRFFDLGVHLYPVLKNLQNLTVLDLNPTRVDLPIDIICILERLPKLKDLKVDFRGFMVLPRPLMEGGQQLQQQQQTAGQTNAGELGGQQQQQFHLASQTTTPHPYDAQWPTSTTTTKSTTTIAPIQHHQGLESLTLRHMLIRSQHLLQILSYCRSLTTGTKTLKSLQVFGCKYIQWSTPTIRSIQQLCPNLKRFQTTHRRWNLDQDNIESFDQEFGKQLTDFGIPAKWLPKFVESATVGMTPRFSFLTRLHVVGWDYYPPEMSIALGKYLRKGAYHLKDLYAIGVLVDLTSEQDDDEDDEEEEERRRHGEDHESVLKRRQWVCHGLETCVLSIVMPEKKVTVVNSNNNNRTGGTRMIVPTISSTTTTPSTSTFSSTTSLASSSSYETSLSSYDNNSLSRCSSASSLSFGEQQQQRQQQQQQQQQPVMQSNSSNSSTSFLSASIPFVLHSTMLSSMSSLSRFSHSGRKSRRSSIDHHHKAFHNGIETMTPIVDPFGNDVHDHSTVATNNHAMTETSACVDPRFSFLKHLTKLRKVMIQEIHGSLAAVSTSSNGYANHQYYHHHHNNNKSSSTTTTTMTTTTSALSLINACNLEQLVYWFNHDFEFLSPPSFSSSSLSISNQPDGNEKFQQFPTIELEKILNTSEDHFRIEYPRLKKIVIAYDEKVHHFLKPVEQLQWRKRFEEVKKGRVELVFRKMDSSRFDAGDEFFFD